MTDAEYRAALQMSFERSGIPAEQAHEFTPVLQFQADLDRGQGLQRLPRCSKLMTA